MKNMSSAGGEGSPIQISKTSDWLLPNAIEGKYRLCYSSIGVQRYCYGMPRICPNGREAGEAKFLWGQLPAHNLEVKFSSVSPALQAPWVSATYALLFLQTTSLLSLLGCLCFWESTSAIFGACVAFFRGKAWKIILCSVSLSSAPVEAAKPNGAVEG